MVSTYSTTVGHFDGQGGLLVQCEAHCPMQHVQGYSGSHWMPASSDYLLRIAPAAARATGKQTTINKYTYKAGRFDGHGNGPVPNHALPNGGDPGFHSKPLDATIGQVLCPIN